MKAFKKFKDEIQGDPDRYWIVYVHAGPYTLCTITDKQRHTEYTGIVKCDDKDTLAGLFSHERGEEIAFGKTARIMFKHKPNYVTLEEAIARFNAEGVVVIADESHKNSLQDGLSVESNQYLADQMMLKTYRTQMASNAAESYAKGRKDATGPHFTTFEEMLSALTNPNFPWGG